MIMINRVPPTIESFQIIVNQILERKCRKIYNHNFK